MISKFWHSLVVVLLCLTQVMLADDVKSGGKPFVSKWGGSGGGQNAHESWRYRTFTTVSGYAARPDNEVLNEVTVEWLPIERDPLGNRCKVSGHLQFSDAGVTRNIDRFQGVAVYLAKQPNQELDWSKGIEQNQASYETGFTVDHSGTFEVWFDLREMQSDRHAEQVYQFGLALGRHEDTELPNQFGFKQSQREKTELGEKITWSSRTAVIPSTVKMIKIPVAPEISRELELINRVNPWFFQLSNHQQYQSTGVDLIRAVNAVRRLGKEKGLATLEEFLKLLGGENYFGDRHNTVVWIIQLAFESDRSKEQILFPEVRDSLNRRDSPERQSWPLDPMELSDDQPFKLTGFNVGGKMALNHSKAHLAWAHENGVIREGLLIPSSDPLTAAQAILLSPKFQRLEESAQREVAQWIPGQAMSMVPDLVEQFRKSNPNNPGDVIDYEAEWAALLEYAKQFDITWDQRSENFIVRPKPK